VGVWLCMLAALAPRRPCPRAICCSLAVDLSGSMETRDFTDASGAQVDRLTAVKQVLDDFLARRTGDRVD